MISVVAKLNDENIQNSLKQSQSSCTKSSATQICELAEIKSRLEENTALVRDTASETKLLSSTFDMYVGFRSLFIPNTDASFRNYFRNFGTDILMFMQKIW